MLALPPPLVYRTVSKTWSLQSVGEVEKKEMVKCDEENKQGTDTSPPLFGPDVNWYVNEKSQPCKEPTDRALGQERSLAFQTLQVGQNETGWEELGESTWEEVGDVKRGP